MNDSEEQTAISAKIAPSSSVGALLKATRTRMGQDLKQVSQALRIRQLFLQAIEDGRYDELPGPTYALGFVRSYSDFLGLDSEEVVRRFRAETTGVGQKELVFPTPAAEKHLPSGAIVAAALALGVLVYGGWYAISSSSRPAAEAVPEVPDRLVKPDEAKKDETPAEAQVPPEEVKAPEKLPEPAKAPEPKPEAKTEPKPEAKIVEPAPKADPVPPKVEPAPPAEAPKKPEPARIEPAKPTLTAPSALPAAAPAQGMGGLAISAQTAKPPTPSTLATTPAPAATANDQPSAAGDEAQRAPKVYGQTDGDVRVVVKANGDSWIQVRDEKGNLVATRLLKKGDSYRVPTGMGKLSLTTGDAGALSATVDGVLVTPSLGPSGSVRRDIALDPDRIKPGNQ